MLLLGTWMILHGFIHKSMVDATGYWLGLSLDEFSSFRTPHSMKIQWEASRPLGPEVRIFTISLPPHSTGQSKPKVGPDAKR